MDLLLESLVVLEGFKNGEKYNDFCIEDSIFYIKKALESLETTDQEKWYNESLFTARVIAKSFPFIFAVQELESLAQDQCSESGEN